MMRSILIGIDDSASDIAAQELGVRWAERFNARLTAITIIQGHGAESSADLVSASVSHHSADPVRIADNRPMVDAGDWQIEKQFGARCREAGVTLELIGDAASPHVQILLEAQNHDIVLLGQRSGFEFGRGREPGSTVARIIQNCPRPLVVVPADSNGGESIVVAYDGSLQASRALWAFEASGLGRGAPVHVLAVGADRQYAARHAERATVFLASHGIDTTPSVAITSQSPAESIIERVESLDAGLLVMGAYGQPVLREFFIGSVTRTLLLESPVPIFCFH